MKKKKKKKEVYTMKLIMITPATGAMDERKWKSLCNRKYKLTKPYALNQYSTGITQVLRPTTESIVSIVNQR